MIGADSMYSPDGIDGNWNAPAASVWRLIAGRLSVQGRQAHGDTGR